MRSLKFLAIVATLLLIATGLCLAQTETGTITGSVTDPSDAVVTGATITVKNINTGAVRTATTNTAGNYTITNLPPAPYEVTIAATGFATYKQKITVTVASANELSAHMKLAAAAGTTIEVVGAGAVQVDTQSSELSQVVSPQQVAELPSLNRNPYDFTATAGNVTTDQAGRGAGGAAINGQRSASTDILLDGAENVDLYSATVGQNVPMDAVQEYRVTTSDFAAEYGRASGGVVNVATKSGTNTFHGSAYEFNRVSKLTSNTYDNNANGIARPRYVRNQFGFSVGGPVIKSKLFFFNNSEWIRVRSIAVNQVYVPDPGFLALADAGTTGAYFSQYGTLKSGLKQLGTVSADSLGYCPEGTCDNPAVTPSTTVLDQVSFPFPANAGGGSPQNNYNIVSRVDFNLSDKTQLFGRYAINGITYMPGSVSYSAYTGFDTGEKDRYQNVMLSITHLWSNNLVSSTKLVYNRLNQLQSLGGLGTAPGLLIGLGGDGYTPTVDGAPSSSSFMLPGYLPYAPGSAIPFGGPQNVSEFDHNFSWTRGKHNFKFGGAYVYVRDNRVFGAYQEGIQYLTSGGAQLGTHGWINQLLGGQLYRFSAAINPEGEFPCYHDPTTNAILQTAACTLTGPASPPDFSRSNRYNDIGMYAQDSWKITPRLTFNLGMRWEYYGVQHAKHSDQNANFFFGSGNMFERFTNGQVLNGDNMPGKRLWARRYHNFGPRVGFAYDIFGDGKTSLRGGLGVAYERNFGNVTFNVIQNPPNYAVLNIVAGRDVGWGSLPISPNNFGAAGNPGTYPFRSPTLRAVDPDIKPAYASVWNLSIEREVLKNSVVALEYSGSRGIHGYTIGNVNDVGFGPAYTGLGCAGTDAVTCYENYDPAQLLNTQYSYMNFRTNGNDSWHDALNARFSSSNLFNQGLNITMNYTWARSIDYLSATFGGSDELNGQSLGTLNPFFPALDKGDADFDVRNRIVVSGVWAPPYAQHSHGVMKEIADGWSFAPIFQAQTGYPYTLYDCTGASSAYTCPRYWPSAPVSRGKGNTGTGAANTLGTNLYAYQDVPAPLLYTDPFGLNSSLATCATDPGTGVTTGSFCVYPAGMSGRNSFREPGTWNMDMSISKNFKVTEKVGLQFRSEFFNIFNHSNYYVQTGNLDSIGGSADVAWLLYSAADSPYYYPQPGTITGGVTGAMNGQLEFCTATSGGTCAGQTGVPYTIQGKKGVTNQAGGLGTGSLGERRFVQFALKITF